MSNCVRKPGTRLCLTHEGSYFGYGTPTCSRRLSTGHHSPSRITVITEAGLRACGVKAEPPPDENPVIVEEAVIKQADGSRWKFRRISEQALHE